MVGNSNNRNHERQYTFSFFDLPLRETNKITIATIIPKPIIVLKKEKRGIRAISNGKRRFANDSGIIRTLAMSGINPYSFRSDEFLRAIDRSQNHNIPEIA